MTDETSGSTVPRRQLGRLLTQLREDASVSLDAAAEGLDCSRQKVWRIEKGLVPVRVVDARAMCEIYRAPEDMKAIVTGLAKETAQRAGGIRTAKLSRPGSPSTSGWNRPPPSCGDTTRN
ncbi:helix-turn-helix domain-containing protein [Micromonospora haikouensis]|uniref:helix-turn-helix domain-containing protein n=1 Tax=Micromonospora haikouensis TaxID=686309 RepID=UPI0037ACC6DE